MSWIISVICNAKQKLHHKQKLSKKKHHVILRNKVNSNYQVGKKISRFIGPFGYEGT